MAARRCLVLLHPPADALLGQQTLHESQVGLAVLHTVAALPSVAGRQSLRHVGGHVFVPVPGSDAGVVGKDVFDDLDDALVLPDAALQAVAEQCDPGAHQQGLASQAAVALQGPSLGDVATAACAATVGQRGQQGDGASVELLELDMGIEHQGVDVEGKGLGDGIVEHEALDHQVGGQRAFAAGRCETIQTGVGVPGCHQRMPQGRGGRWQWRQLRHAGQLTGSARQNHGVPG